MSCYNITFRSSRQPDRGDGIVPLGASGITRGPLSRDRRDWRVGLAGTALVHLGAVLPVLLLVSHRRPPNLPAEPTVQMVFAPPAPMQVPSPTQSVEPTPPSVQEPPSQDPPAPPMPAPPQQPIPLPVVQQPEAQAPLALTPVPKPLALPPAAPPPPKRAATRKAVMLPPKASAVLASPSNRPSSPTPASEPASPSQPAIVSSAWRQELAAWLAEHKTYPEEARRRGIEGSVTLRFCVDQSGHVIDVTVLRGSGSSILELSC